MMCAANHDAEALKLFDSLVENMPKKRDKEEPQSNLLFDLYLMKDNNKSQAFLTSGAWIEPACASTLMDEGLIQRVSTEGPEKYSLTFKGVAYCIRARYGISYEAQFMTFLESADCKFTSSAKNPFDWDEKLVTISLLLTAATSEAAALHLKDESDQRTLSEVFYAVLSFLKKHNLVKPSQDLPKPKRGEFPAPAVMSRVTELPRKTNHYYKYADKLTYYLEVENKSLDRSKVQFLLKKIFDSSDPEADYREWCSELLEIAERFDHRFQGRRMNPLTPGEIKGVLREFFEAEIFHMPRAKK